MYALGQYVLKFALVFGRRERVVRDTKKKNSASSSSSSLIKKKGTRGGKSSTHTARSSERARGRRRVFSTNKLKDKLSTSCRVISCRFFQPASFAYTVILWAEIDETTT